MWPNNKLTSDSQGAANLLYLSALAVVAPTDNPLSCLPFPLEILSILSSTVSEQTGEESTGYIERPLLPS